MTPLVLLEVEVQASTHYVKAKHVEELLDKSGALAIRYAIIERLSLIGSRDSAADRVS